MADRLSPTRRSENMRRIKGKDTAPEMVVRRLVHGMGYRYRLHAKDLPGKPDLVFRRRKAVVFVHGCFWHQHDCRDGRQPGSRQDYWRPKLARNVERDRDAVERLITDGWRVLVVWECETGDTMVLARRLSKFLDADCAQLASDTPTIMPRTGHT